EAEPPHLEALSPAYKLYPLGAEAAPAWQGVPRDAVAPLPRQNGAGYAEARAGRLVPLLEATDGEGSRRGPLAWEMLRAGAPQAGAAWVCVGTTDAEWWQRNRAALVRLLGGAARQLV